MSIIGIRKSFEKKGCQIALILVCAAAMLGIAGVMTLQGVTSLFGIGPGASENDPLAKQPAFSALGTDISMRHYLDRVELMQQNSQMQANTPLQVVNNYGGAAAGDIALLASRNLAAKYGASVTEDDAVRYFTESIDQQLMISRMQIQVNGTLPPGATEEQIDAEFAKVFGGTAGDIRREAIDNFKTSFENADTRAAALEQYLINALAAAYASRVTVTEEELKASYDQFLFNRLVIKSSIDPGVDAAAEAAKAREELAGGASYASVYRKYTGDEGDAPASYPMGRRTIEANENFAELLELQPNEISQVITDFEGASIYQLISVKNEIPENFEENKDQLMANLRTTKGNAQLTKEVDELSNPEGITWHSIGIQVLYEGLTALNEDPDNDKMLELLDQATEARVTDPLLDRALVCLRYELYTALSRSLLASELATLEEQTEEILADVLTYIESLTIRLQLSEHFYQIGASDDGFGELVSAAQGIAGYDPSATFSVSQIESALEVRKTAGLVTPEQEADLQAALDEVRADMKLREEDEAAAAAEREEARLELEEENRKQQEEADAKAAAEEADAAAESGTEAEGDSTEESGS